MGERKIDVKAQVFHRKVRLKGLTEAQREKHLGIYKNKLEPQGWVLDSVKKNGFLDHHALFSRDTEPTVSEKIVWGLSENRLAVSFILVLLMILAWVSFVNPKIGIPLFMTIIFGSLYLITRASLLKFLSFCTSCVLVLQLLIFSHQQEQKRKYDAALAAKENESRYSERVNTGKKVVTEFKKVIDSSGMDSGITDITIDKNGIILIKVTDAWLLRPEFAQTQDKQVIERMLKLIWRPKGWEFKIIDRFGNEF